MKRVAIFVDGANVYYSQRDKLQWSIDWKRLLTLFERDYEVVEAFYYRPDGGGGTDSFAKMLVASGYTLRKKALKQVTNESSGNTITKGNMDVELVIDALNACPRYDTCLLVSGDGDFVPLVEELRNRGKTVSVLSTFGSVAFELRSAVGKNYHDLQTLRSDVEYLALPPTTGSTPDVEEAGHPPDLISESDCGVLAERMEGSAIARSTDADSEPRVDKAVEASVVRYAGGGVTLAAADGTELYLPVTNLHLSGYVSNLPALIQIGDRFSVIVASLDERTTPPRKIVRLTSDADRDRLQQRLHELTPTLEDLPNEGEFDMDVQVVKKFGAFLRNSWNVPMLLHVSAMNIGRVQDCRTIIQPGERMRVRVTGREQTADGPRIISVLADEAYRQKLLARLPVATSS